MKQVYLALAALLLLCLAPMPYGYYMLVRLVAMAVFGLMAYRYYEREKATAAVIFGMLALLFQPIYKIALGRTVWNVVDVAVAALLVGLYAMEKRMAKKTDQRHPQPPPQDQQKTEDIEVVFSLGGKLSPTELVYVASEEDKALTELFEPHPEVLDGWGRMIGFQVIYLPLLIKKLQDKRVLQYRAPYLSEAELTDVTVGNDFILQFLENPKDRNRLKQGFLRTENIHRGSDGKDRAINRFYPLSSASGEPLANQLHRIGKQLLAEKGEVLFERHGTENQLSPSESRSTRYIEHKPREADNDSYEVDNREPSDEPSELGFRPQEEEEPTDDLLEEVRQRIALLRQRGVAEYILEQLIHPDNRLSRMVITRDCRILLPDYNDMEIRMEPLVKAVYLLFLRHPEGIVFKCLPDYRQELTDIYSKLKPLGLSGKAIQSIEDVTNPLLNSINEKCARIRGAFLGQFDDHMARSYYINGARGEAKKISLPRNLVEWE